MDKQNKDGLNALGLCLERFQTKNSIIYHKLADLLIENGSNVNILNDKTKDSLLHLACKNKNEDAGEYLIKNNSIVDLYNQDGEEPIHIASRNGLNKLVKLLLENGVNCNCTTLPSENNNQLNDHEVIYNQTPLHLAVENKHEDIVKTILNFKLQATGSNDLASNLIPDLNIKNSKDQTPLLIALDTEQHLIAQILIDEGIND